MNMTVIADSRGFLQQAPFMPAILFHVDYSVFYRSFLLLSLPDYGKSVFIICQDWYVNPFAPDPSLEMLWVLLEEWLLSSLSTSLGGLYTSTLRIPSGKDWIWYPGQYLGNRSLSTFCLFLLFRCTPRFLNVSVCVAYSDIFFYAFLFQQFFQHFSSMSLWPTKFTQRTNVSRVTVTVSQPPSPEGHGCRDPAAGATDLAAQSLSQFPTSFSTPALWLWWFPIKCNHDY